MVTHRHGNECHEGRFLYSQIPRKRSHATAHRTTWEVLGQSRGRGNEGQMGKSFYSGFCGKKEVR